MVGTPYPTPKGCTNVATEGQDFWVAFGNNNNSAASQVYLALQLNNGNATAVTVTLTFTAKTGVNTASYTVPANSSLQVDLSAVPSLGDMRASVYQTSTTTVTNSNTLHITCPAIISVIIFNTQSATTDASILLPPRIWGQDYYNLSYVSNVSGNINIVVANQDNTNVYINGSSTAAATLQTGQVYYASSANDLTGTHITTDKPVAYFVHDILAGVPFNGGGATDILFQQLMPVGQYGQYFLVPNETQFNTTSTAAQGTNIVRLLATQANTVVSFTNATSRDGQDGYTFPAGYVSPGTGGSAVSSVTLNAGQWTEVQIAGAQNSYCTISATKPIGVIDLMGGGGINKTMGDPAICRINQVDNMITTAVIAPFIPPAAFSNGGSSNLGKVGYPVIGYGVTPRHYMLIISPTASKDNVTISRSSTSLGTLTAAAAAVPNLTDPNNTNSDPSNPINIISAPTTWVDVPTPINGVLYSYIRYDFNYLTDRSASFRITSPNGFQVTQVGIGYMESYTFNSGSGGCLVNY